MESIGMKDFRTGPINEVVSLAFYPELGTPVPLETYVCKGCGKLELFADELSIKLLKGEYAGPPLAKCGRCGRQFVTEYSKCPYCGETVSG